MTDDISFIRLNRKFFRNFLWKEERVYSRAEAWLDLVQSVAYEPQKKIVGSELIELPRGGIVASERFLSSRWQWSRTKVRTFLDLLLAERMITRPPEKDHRNTILILSNYERYNPRRDLFLDQSRTAERPLPDQSKERIEGKEPKKSLSAGAPPQADHNDELWRSQDWQSLGQEEAIEKLGAHFPGIDVCGEYRRYAQLRASQGQQPTWRPFLSWLRKATPVMNLAVRKPAAKARPTLPGAAEWQAFIADQYPDAHDPGPARDAPESLLKEFATWHRSQPTKTTS